MGSNLLTIGCRYSKGVFGCLHEAQPGPRGKETEYFGWLHTLLGLHSTKLKAPLGLARWKRSDRQFLASQAEASASERALARVETGGMRGDYVRSSSTSSKLLSNLLSSLSL